MKVLVAGSVHLDILAEVECSTSQNIDKIGKLRYSVGGTAFNVAANLAYHHKDVSLYTALKEASFSSSVIRKELELRRIGTNFVRDLPMSAESGFVAHMAGGQLVSAVSCISIQDVVFEDSEILRAMQGCSMVSIECNLARDQIQQFARLAHSKRLPICACAVSESKVMRIFNAFTFCASPIFNFVILNEAELEKVIDKDTDFNAGFLCRSFSAEHVVLTKGRLGFTLMSAAGDTSHHQIPIETVVSTIGAGDALYAAICCHFAEKGTLDTNTIENDAKRFLVPVLTSLAGSPDIIRQGRKSLFPVSIEGASLTGALTLLASVLAVVVGLFGPNVSRLTFGILLFAVSILSGIAGSQVEHLLSTKDADLYSVVNGESLLRKGTLGAAAGLTSGTMFFLPQIISNKEFQTITSIVPFQMLLLLPFCLIIGFIGGLTADSLFRRIKMVDVQSIRVPGSSIHSCPSKDS